MSVSMDDVKGEATETRLLAAETAGVFARHVTALEGEGVPFLADVKRA
jgi:hypothetical protein